MHKSSGFELDFEFWVNGVDTYISKEFYIAL